MRRASLPEIQSTLAPMSPQRRDEFIQRNCTPAWHGLFRTLFLRAPVLPIVESDNE